MRKVFHIAEGVCIAALCIVLGGLNAKAASGVAINASNFPDESFRKIVSERDENKDGELSLEEISATKSLTVGQFHGDFIGDVERKQADSIKSVDGIQYFTELTELFIGFADDYEGRCQLGVTSVDLSKNTKLKKLKIYAKVAKLDLSANTEIKDLEIYSENIRTLDITALKKLERLRLNMCSRLTNLDLYSVKSIDEIGYRLGHDDLDLPGTFCECGKLSLITFEGDAPKFDKYSFTDPILVATIFYPKGNKTWNKVKGKNYGGLITWKAYNPADGSLSDEQDKDALPKLPANTKFGNEAIGGSYKVLSNGKTLEFVKPIINEGTESDMIEIFSTVKIGGHDYPVTSIGKEAFKGYNNLKYLHVSGNLKKINKDAFKGFNRKNKVKIYISTKNKKTFKKVRKLLKKAAPRNVKYKH